MSKCVKCGNEILTGDIHWEMGLCNNCYNELYKDHKTHISLDKMWLELAIRFRDENDELQSKITDLEAKLAESESKLRVSNSSLASSQLEYNQLKKEYDEQEKLLRKVLATNSRLQFEFDQLKQQLAEKDDEIEKLNNKLASNSKWLKLLNKQFVQIRNHNQDKIELLEKILNLTDGRTYLAQYIKEQIETLRGKDEID